MAVVMGYGKALGDPAGQVLQSLRREAVFQVVLIAPVHFGIGLFQESSPEFGWINGSKEQQATLVSRQPIVNDNLVPVTESPEAKAKYA